MPALTQYSQASSITSTVGEAHERSRWYGTPRRWTRCDVSSGAVVIASAHPASYMAADALTLSLTLYSADGGGPFE